MLNRSLDSIDTEALDYILYDALDWLIQKFGDASLAYNKLNHTKKYSPLRHYTTKHRLKYSWHYDPEYLDWIYYGQYAHYDPINNTIFIHCNRAETLGFALDCMFHEYRHSQQSMRKYRYYRGSYESHPLEKDANEFALEWLPVYAEARLVSIEF